MEVNSKMVIGIGIALVGAGEAYSIWKAHKAAKELKKFNDAVTELSGNINVDIPDQVMDIAISRAAEREANVAAKKVTDDAKRIIESSVDKVIADEKANISDSVKTELEKKLNLVDIEDIKKSVVKDVGFTITDSLAQRLPFLYSRGANDTASIIRACKDAGITNSWRIEDILRTAKEA